MHWSWHYLGLPIVSLQQDQDGLCPGFPVSYLIILLFPIFSYHLGSLEYLWISMFYIVPPPTSHQLPTLHILQLGFLPQLFPIDLFTLDLVQCGFVQHNTNSSLGKGITLLSAGPMLFPQDICIHPSTTSGKTVIAHDRHGDKPSVCQVLHTQTGGALDPHCYLGHLKVRITDSNSEDENCSVFSTFKIRWGQTAIDPVTMCTC